MHTILIILILVNCAWSQRGRTQLESLLIPFRTGRILFNGFLLAGHEENWNYLVEQRKMQPKLPKAVRFPCIMETPRSPEKPESVHRLRPGDIDVIGAIGDSLTAGFGATAINLFEVLIEERGKSFTGGGEATWREYLTLPNILKEFNNNLTGFALGPTLSIQENSQFNVAEGGAILKDTPYMARVLIDRIKSNPKVNFQEDWKMVSILIGHNDFCAFVCYDSESIDQDLENHKKDLLKLLRILRDHLPRTFVNLIPPPNLRKLVELKGIPPVCYLSHIVECPCLFGHHAEKNKQIFFDYMTKWQKLDLEVASFGEFDLDNFTVAAQPLFINYTFPKKSNGNSDLDYLSKDCFHFSQKAHARAANDLWNNLMEPVGKKSLNGRDVFTRFLCPSRRHPYIWTRRNSIT